MKQFISGLIVGFILCFVLLNFGQIKTKFSKAYRQTVAEQRRGNRSNNRSSVQPSQASLSAEKAGKSSNQKASTKVSPLFKDIPQQIIDSKPAAEQEKTNQSLENETVKKSTPVLPGLLATLREKGGLDYTQQYSITSEERALYQKYIQVQEEYNRAIQQPRLSMSRIKKYKSDHDDQLQKLADQYRISVSQLSELEKYMKRVD